MDIFICVYNNDSQQVRKQMIIWHKCLSLLWVKDEMLYQNNVSHVVWSRDNFIGHTYLEAILVDAGVGFQPAYHLLLLLWLQVAVDSGLLLGRSCMIKITCLPTITVLRGIEEEGSHCGGSQRPFPPCLKTSASRFSADGFYLSCFIYLHIWLAQILAFFRPVLSCLLQKTVWMVIWPWLRSRPKIEMLVTSVVYIWSHFFNVGNV